MQSEKKAAKPKSQSQRERFIETARKLEADESGERFEKLLAKAAPKRTGKVIYGDLEKGKNN